MAESVAKARVGKESDGTRKSGGLSPGVSLPVVARNSEYSIPAPQKSLPISLAEIHWQNVVL
jgi:hypothetical protein